ncbi:PAS domain S-box-containing protein [Catalinimonas alkaloidigena]|uniref:histidine kinase n=1 Tax=Catalinimonas alkaloidigena TaxID=1075417 RepID=A0A1G9UAM8_9BACT|nr:ATP-binding protein [Catalinimonas alkaloidigena]SDM57020.1 PAS domain S-box-containing protein [Catalinimonas alkaloidigena]
MSIGTSSGKWGRRVGSVLVLVAGVGALLTIGLALGWFRTTGAWVVGGLGVVLVWSIWQWQGAVLRHRRAEQALQALQAEPGAANAVHSNIAGQGPELRLEESRQLLQAILDFSPTIIFVKDVEGRYLMVNRGYSEFYGLTEDAIRGKNDTELYSEAVSQMLRAHDQHVLETGTRQSYLERVPFHGEVRDYISVKFPLYDARGQAIAVCGIATDISEQIKNERLLREKEQKIQLAAEGAGLALWEWDLTTHTLQADSRLFELLHQPTETTTLNRTATLALIHPDERAGLRQALTGYLDQPTTPAAPFRLELRLLTGTREWKWVLVQGVLRTPETDGQPRRLIGIVQDVDAQKKYEQSLEQQNQKILDTNRELESFSYTVSHDLRAPLRSIDGFVRILRQEYTDVFDAEGRRMLSVIEDSVQHMNRLIEALLNYSRLGRLEIRRTTLPTAPIFEEVFQEVNATYGGSAQLRLPDALPAVFADRNLLRIVIWNLVSNALKFSAKKSRPLVEVEATSDEHYHTFIIKDNGVGFDMKDVEKLFQVFQRLHVAHQFEGTGIGLATVARIVKRHGGQVAAVAVPGQGASFTFTLPVHQPVASTWEPGSAVAMDV